MRITTEEAMNLYFYLALLGACIGAGVAQYLALGVLP